MRSYLSYGSSGPEWLPYLTERPRIVPRLPVWPAPVLAGAAPRRLLDARPLDLQPGRGLILVVDDDPSILATISDVLEYEDYQVERAHDGAEALVILGRLEPRLILLDMNMPVLNGWELASRLKRSGSTVPIIVMTAAQDARRSAEEIEAEGYIAKPFDLVELLEVVARFCE